MFKLESIFVDLTRDEVKPYFEATVREFAELKDGGLVSRGDVVVRGSFEDKKVLDGEAALVDAVKVELSKDQRLSGKLVE